MKWLMFVLVVILAAGACSPPPPTMSVPVVTPTPQPTDETEALPPATEEAVPLSVEAGVYKACKDGYTFTAGRRDQDLTLQEDKFASLAIGVPSVGILVPNGASLMAEFNMGENRSLAVVLRNRHMAAQSMTWSDFLNEMQAETEIVVHKASIAWTLLFHSDCDFDLSEIRRHFDLQADFPNAFRYDLVISEIDENSKLDFVSYPTDVK